MDEEQGVLVDRNRTIPRHEECNMRPHSRLVCLILSLCLLAYVMPAFAQGNSGTILSLVVTGGAQVGDTITISSQVRADSRIQRSNLVYTILAPDGVTIVGTQTATPPNNMAIGEIYNHSWNTNNSGFPTQGTYSVTLCWSTGNATNCDIATATTNFYSVPTLGWMLSLVAVVLIGYWIYTRRLEFVRAT